MGKWENTMKRMSIPFTKFSIQFRKYAGSSVCNGNGFSHNTLEITFRKNIGNGDDGTRSCGLSANE